MQTPGFSIPLFALLMLIFIASLLTFVVLVRRSTTRRRWVWLSEWAQQRKFSKRASDQFAPSLRKRLNREFEILLQLNRPDLALMQIQTESAQRWNLLLQKRRSAQSAAAGLRPTVASASVLDLSGLSNFSSQTIGPRFTVLASSSSAARALADSPSRTLVPADIGLLLAEDWLLLDFSTRPFDPIELDRILALAEQLGRLL
jgi:hypothetical protein